jgi:hypothetical protein
MTRLLVVLHIGALLGAYFVFGVALLTPRTTYVHPHEAITRFAVSALSATSFLAGMVLLSRKQLRNIGVALAISTIAALLLLLLSI